MKNAYLYKSSLVIKIALATAILLIAYITVVFFNQMQTLSDSVSRMSNANRKLIEMEEILSVLSINESSVRSYIISRDSTYLKKRFRPESDAAKMLGRLEELNAEIKSKNLSVPKVRQMLRDRFRLFDTMLARAGSGSQHSSSLIYELATADLASDRIKNYLRHAMKDEAATVHKYEIEHHYKIETSILTSFFLVTVALFILLLSLNRVNSDLTNLKKLNDELKFLNFTFNNAEKIAGISHWKYNLKSKKFSFSDNFYRLLGLDRNELEISDIRHILHKLHPEDRDKVIDSYNESLKKKTTTSLIYRIYAGNNEMRYIQSVGSFAENSRGEIVKIAVNYDITEQYKNTLELEENNRNLIAINAELESFNNIVSHDLQEPLRKIQMFISRIDGEMESLSVQGRDYFNRIRISANRMQSLLIDLVNYSRTIKGELRFEPCDLSAVLNDVQVELELSIQEKDAVITCETLPSIEAIAFQMHQLFLNLLSNSLKFSKEGVTPKIEIANAAIDNPIFINDKQISAEDFIAITISDNGIGFKQEFAEKIFELFKRLEVENYQGTGIGLAICRKIVEIHNGHIVAQGNVGEGATFTIWLPKKRI